MHFFFFFSFCEFPVVSDPKCLRGVLCPKPSLHSLYPLGLVAVRAQSTGRSSSPSKQCHIWVNYADEPEFENSDTQLSPKPPKQICMENLGRFFYFSPSPSCVPLTLREMYPVPRLPFCAYLVALSLRVHFADLMTQHWQMKCPEWRNWVVTLKPEGVLDVFSKYKQSWKSRNHFFFTPPLICQANITAHKRPLLLAAVSWPHLCPFPFWLKYSFSML